MSRISGASNALFVIDDVGSARNAAASADLVFATEIDWTILAVIPERPEFTSGATGFAGPVLSLEQMDSLAVADLVAGDAATAATARAFGRRPATQAVVRGRHAAAVRRYLAEHPADLVVVDSPSLAEDLVDDGIVPVLVMPSGPPRPSGGPVILAVDDSPLDNAVADTASRLFDLTTTDFVAVHVDAARSVVQSIPIATITPGIPGATLVSILADDLEAASVEAEEVASNAIADTDLHTAAQTVGEAGDPASGILTTAQDHDAAMIVLGTHDRGWLARLFRPSVSDAVLRQAQCPVLVISTPSAQTTEGADHT